MNANGVNIGREGESLNITNINLLIRFNKTREIVKWREIAKWRGELSPAITRLMSKCL